MGGEYGDQWRQSLASALLWWRDAGVDTLADDEPRDWLALPVAKAAARAAEPAVASAPAEILPDTLDAFLDWRLGEAAPEAEWLTPRIGPSGDPGAGLMILTDMPEPDDSDRLMTGAPGRLLDRMLAAIGESRESVYLASLAVARPLTGRIPAESEPRLIELALHHIELANPKRLLLLGQSASRVRSTTNGSDAGNAREDIKDDVKQLSQDRQVVASYHPRFLLERPAAKAEAWKHLVLLSRGTSQ
ncbi:MAG: uracil-DNA glycosylase family protein [Pseudomonadota bacterium]